MKRTELKTLIRQAAEREMPNVLEKIHLSDVDIVPATVRKPRPVFRLANVLSFAALALVLGFTSLLIYQALNPVVPPQTVALDSEAEVYGFQMVSAASLLDSAEPLGLSLVPLSMQSETPLISDQIEDLTAYMNLMETMLGDLEGVAFTPTPSDRAEFETMIVFDSTDLLGTSISRRIYYNEILDPSDGDKTYLEGLMVLAEREFQLRGTITENEDGVKTRFLAMIDEDNYVSVEDKSTDDSQMFRFQVVEAGVLVQENEIRLVLEEDEITAVIDYETESVKVQYRLRKSTGEDTGSIIRVQYSCMGTDDDLEDGEIDVTVEYDETTSAYRYHFQVTTKHGMHSGNHSFSGTRTVKTDEGDNGGNGNHNPNGGNDEDSGNDDTTTTHPGNADDEPGNDDSPAGNHTTSGSDDGGKGNGTGSPNGQQPQKSPDEEPDSSSSLQSDVLVNV